MKYRYLSLILILVCSGILLSAPTPGSAQDPLITESYLLLLLEQEEAARDQLAGRIALLEQQLLGLQADSQTSPPAGSTTTMALASLAERVSQLENLISGIDLSSLATNQPAVGSAQELEVISLQKGEAVFASAGAEIILRAGELQVLANATGGLADVTSGLDLQHGEAVPRNHLLLVPRDDGRGVVAISDAVFLLRGTIRYTDAP